MVLSTLCLLSLPHGREVVGLMPAVTRLHSKRLFFLGILFSGVLHARLWIIIERWKHLLFFFCCKINLGAKIKLSLPSFQGSPGAASSARNSAQPSRPDHHGDPAVGQSRSWVRHVRLLRFLRHHIVHCRLQIQPEDARLRSHGENKISVASFYSSLNKKPFCLELSKLPLSEIKQAAELLLSR